MQEMAERRELMALTGKMIQKGSKSFSMASRLFGRSEREAAVLLYGWCRYCDDVIDNSASQGTVENLKAELDKLRALTSACYESTDVTEPVFRGFQYLVRKYQIPSVYPFELLEGLRMDVEKAQYRTFDDVVLYCYRVAGTVGLMMSHIMGVSNLGALRHAAHLGMAMQLTNIARDVMEDAEMGRVYLPADWFPGEVVTPAWVLDPAHRSLVFDRVRKLLGQAEEYYHSGDAGLKFLSFRSAVTISAARGIYSDIGAKLIRAGVHAWDERVHTTMWRKLYLVVKAALRLSADLPSRSRYPWRKAAICQTWRPV